MGSIYYDSNNYNDNHDYNYNHYNHDNGYNHEYNDYYDYNNNESSHSMDEIFDTYILNFTFLFFISTVCISIFCRGNGSYPDSIERSRRNRNTTNIESPLLNPDDVEKKELTYTNETYSDKECTICLEDFNENEKIYGLKCNHYYHKKCIDDWLKKHQTCPLCRLNLI